MNGDRASSLLGSCHCGNLRVRFSPSRPVAELSVRACQCSFCRRHGALSVSDPNGHVTFAASDEAKLHRYRFGLGTADFLICRACGVYVGVTFSEGERSYGVVNVLALDDRDAFAPASPVTYEGEDEATRLARRKVRWTPASFER